VPAVDGCFVLRLRCREAALLLLSLHLYGCYTWRPTTLSPLQAIEDEKPAQVRITSMRGDRIVVHDPLIREDSVAGTAEAYRRVELPATGGAFAGGVDARADTAAAIAISDIQMIEVRRRSGLRTVGLIVLTVPVVLVVVGSVACASGGTRIC